MAQKPSIPKGTRDFGPAEMAGRNYIFDTIKSVFRTYGYMPIETPAMENLSTLLGKYGDEGDKLLFRILNSGDAFSGVDFGAFRTEDGGYNSKSLSLKVCEKGLRYDLTVPFARFVVQHQNELSFPFKRYQIQPVWRADRPQKGRYREFYQCDADVIGSRSLLNELELVQIVDRVFMLFGINVVVKINNRKVLAGLAEISGFPDKVVDITVAIDKIDKIGLEAVKAEMREKGLTDDAIAVIEPVLTLKGDYKEKISSMRALMEGKSVSGIVSETGLKGLDELEELFGLTDAAGISQEVEIDLSLARGLNYYTGAIFEVKAKDFEIGSICGGGRYDNLTGIFGLPDMSGVGISFGADRIVGTGNVEFAYNEMWAGEDQYTDLRRAIEDNISYGGSDMKTVFAAYMNYNKADNIGSFNTPGVLLTDAVIFALGGSHLEMGEHMLCKEYFPNTYYDFMTAYQNLLRDGGKFNSITVTSADGSVNIKDWEPATGSIITLGKEFDERQVIHFLNFINANSTSWRDLDGSMPEPSVVGNFTVTIQLPSGKNVGSAWIASPDTDYGASRALAFSQNGTELSITIPSLKYWSMLVLEYE